MKKSFKIRFSAKLFMVWSILGLPSVAYAYLDPGTGSLVFQMAVAGFLGAVLYVRLAWDRIKLFFSRLFSSRSNPDKEPLDVDNP